MLRLNLCVGIRSVKGLSKKSWVACSSFHTSQPVHKYKPVDYDGTKARDAERARIVASLQNKENDTVATKGTAEAKVSYFSWKGIMKLRELAKDVLKKYGLIAVVSYSTLYLSMAGSYFLLLDNGIVSTASFGFDQHETAMKFARHLDNIFNDPNIPAYVEANPRVSTAVLALALSEASEPIRLGILWFAVPRIAKLLGRA